VAHYNIVAQLAKEFISGDTSDLVDIITFVEAPWGLNLKLLPVQRFILKCYYGLPLEDKVRNIEIPDVVNEKLIGTHSEKSLLKWLYEEGRCNTDSTEGKNFRDLNLVIGRRGTKSTLAACISNYELYKLVKRGDPCAYYETPPQFPIAVLNVAPTDDQSSVVFDMIQTMALRCPYLKDRSLNQTMTYFNLQTDDDRAQTGKKASLISVAGGCSSNSLRGRNAIVVVMDEMAFFIDNGGRFSGDEVWRALQPSTTTFKGDGKVITISSPYGKFGKFWDIYNDSFQEQDYTLMFKMYSAMVNPNIPSEELKVARRRNRVAFMCEFGGEFSDAVTAWVEDENEFKMCVYPRERPNRGKWGAKYFYGLDLGFKNDGTAIVVVHKEGRKIILDYAEVWFAGPSDVWDIEDSIYRNCNKYSHLDLLRMSDIVNEVKALQRWYPITAGVFDQRDGYGLAELFQGAKIIQFKMKHFTDLLNHQVYEMAKRLYSEGLVDMFDDPVLIPELLTLEAEKKTGRGSIPKEGDTLESFKGKVKVRAPRRKGAHDDISDAWARAVWLCNTTTFENRLNISTGVGGGVRASQVVGQRKPEEDNGVQLPPKKGMPQTQLAYALKKQKMHGAHPRGAHRLKKRLPGAMRR